MHLLSAVANCPEMTGLTDHPATFGYAWPTPGWNVHVYHSHLDVHSPVRLRMPFPVRLVNWTDGPPRRDIRWPDPASAIEATAGPATDLACPLT